MLRTFFGKKSPAFKPAASDMAGLIGRKPVNLDTPELQRFLAGKRVMVTGAGGSIGSEICRQMMKFCPRSLVMVERAENALFEIDRELRHTWKGADIRPYVADVTDATRVARLFADEQPQVVFHAAAHKHVPMMELHPGEAVKNNVLGTKVVADAARDAGCSAFVLISTDKAVNPTSVMGASKRCAELYVQSLNSGRWAVDGGQPEETQFSAHYPLSNVHSSATRFVAVRFGNVLGSSGSVVPIFQKQIDAGGPVTVTHPDMRRFFMTIPEASQLVMHAGAIGNGGEIFVLDMGEPVRILELAEAMIRRRGLQPGKDIQIEFSGIRPGEKLDEELTSQDEMVRPTSHPRINVREHSARGGVDVDYMISRLAGVVDGTRDEVVGALMDCVGEYTPAVTPLVDQASALRALASAANRAA